MITTLTTILTAKKTKKTAKIFSLGCLSLMIAACTQTNAAQIQNVAGLPSAGGAAVYNKPPTNISTGQGNQNTNVTTNTVVNSPSYTSGDSSGVTTVQERMVYNRNYEDIPKGGYQGDSYTVKRGDTLFYIAWITGNDFRSLAAKNNIKEPYDLNVGKVIDVSGGTTVVVTQKTTTNGQAGQSRPTTTTTTTTTTSNDTAPIKTTQTVTNVMPNTINSANSTTVANISWQWPANGPIIEKFSTASKGIDISGSLGDKVVAAADGRVVYSGNALPGYGNLIIIKHSDDYLTAYAHNQTILVKEQQAIKAGQQISTMGNTGTSSVRLHFEIRYKAQSVDPLKYLPKQ